MKNISIWKDYSKKTNYNKLDKDLDIDVLIIGGGITGVSTLYHLKDNNLSVALVEQNKIAYSTTGNSTGKLSFLQNDLLDKIRKYSGDKNAFSYISFQVDGMNKIVKLINDKKIDCDLTKVDSYLYTNKENEINKLKELSKFLNNRGINTKETLNNLVESKYMFSVDNTYMINPIKFIYGLLKDNTYPIYEDTSIIKIEKKKDSYISYTKDNKIKSKWVVIASHYPYFIKPMFFPIKVSLEKSYISASKKKIDKISLISYSNPFISIRAYKDYLIYLSNSHIINKDVDDLSNFNEVLKKVKDLKLNPDYLWSNIDIMTPDGMPYIGRFKDNMLISTGYNTWGLINGFMGGSILSDIINKKKNKYTELFSPNRGSLGLIPTYFGNIVKNIEGYIKGINSNVDTRYIDGKKVMCKDKHKVEKKCPHAKCGLRYNEIEHTWDCPCHGSRFDINGKCISGPANRDITVSDND